MNRFFSLLLLALGLAGTGSARAAEPPATLAIADATTLEGNSRYREVLFPVTLSRAFHRCECFFCHQTDYRNR